VCRNPFWEIPERVIDINDRFISVMNDTDKEVRSGPIENTYLTKR
jgi:hypothetical protein